jgi:uncharacterized protein
MRIGVISDTHIPFFAGEIPREVREELASCDLIVHAGDIVESSVLDELRKIAHTKAVKGNMDSDEIKRTLPESLVFDAEGKKVGVVHGKGSGKTVLSWVKNFFTNKPDVVIFGHSHIPFNEKIGSTLFFNPGSATDNIFSKKRTYGIIHIEGNDVRGEIVEISRG